MIHLSTKRIGHTAASETPPLEPGMADLFRRAWLDAANVAFWFWESATAIVFARILGPRKEPQRRAMMSKEDHQDWIRRASCRRT